MPRTSSNHIDRTLQLHVKLSPEEVKKVDILATRLGCDNRSILIRTLIRNKYEELLSGVKRNGE